MAENWDDKFDYLSAGWGHNDDYWQFLVRQVWRLHERPCRVVDFGCGCGRTGLFLMPLLAPGSTYTGFDQSEALLDKGRPLLAGRPYEAKLLQGDVHSAPLEDSLFDVAIAHTVLMHVPKPEAVIREMIRVTRHGGMVITCDATRNAHNAMLYIHESEEHDHSPLSLFQTMNADIRRRTGVDYNIGMKTPILMHQAGLRDVGARISDMVWLLLPPLDTPEKEKLFKRICDDGLGWCPSDDKSVQEWKERLVSHGVPEDEAQAQIGREIERDFPHKGRQYHTVYPCLLTFSYGTVCKE